MIEQISIETLTTIIIFLIAYIIIKQVSYNKLTKKNPTQSKYSEVLHSDKYKVKKQNL